MCVSATLPVNLLSVFHPILIRLSGGEGLALRLFLLTIAYMNITPSLFSRYQLESTSSRILWAADVVVVYYHWAYLVSYTIEFCHKYLDSDDEQKVFAMLTTNPLNDLIHISLFPGTVYVLNRPLTRPTC